VGDCLTIHGVGIKTLHRFVVKMFLSGYPVEEIAELFELKVEGVVFILREEGLYE
jgi:hypothetical protein